MFDIAKNNTHDDTTTDENVEKVLVNGVAEIKCDVSSNIDGDQVLLVVWYKNNLPIYRWEYIFTFCIAHFVRMAEWMKVGTDKLLNHIGGIPKRYYAFNEC